VLGVGEVEEGEVVEEPGLVFEDVDEVERVEFV